MTKPKDEEVPPPVEPVTPPPPAANPWDAEKATMQAQLAAKDKELAEAKKVVAPKGPVDNAEERAKERARLDKLEKRDEIRDIAEKHGISPEQAEKVHAIASESPHLKPSEHLIIAKARDPELWKAPNPATAQGYHGSARPSIGGGPPQEVDPFKRMIADTKKAGTRIERDQGLATICGAAMAKAMGEKHPALR